MDADERLYRRVAAVFGQQQPLSAAFAFQQPKLGEDPSGLSFNRSALSKPEEVLQGKDGAGVMAVRVGDVPLECSQGQVAFAFAVEHHPLRGNRAHSEIHPYDSTGTMVPYPPPAIRKMYRERLARIAVAVPIS